MEGLMIQSYTICYSHDELYERQQTKNTLKWSNYERSNHDSIRARAATQKTGKKN